MANPLLASQSRREVLRNGGLLGMLALFVGTAAQITPANAAYSREELMAHLYRLTKDNDALTAQITAEVLACIKAGSFEVLKNPDSEKPIIMLDPTTKKPVFNIERTEFLASIVMSLRLIERQAQKLLKEDPNIAELYKTKPAIALAEANKMARNHYKDGSAFECVDRCGEAALIGVLARGNALPPSNRIKLIPKPSAPVGADIAVPQKRASL